MFVYYSISYFALSGPGYLRRYSDWLRAGWSGNRMPVEARFFAHIHTGLAVYPAACKIGTGSFAEVMRPGHCADHPPLLAPMSRMSGAIPLLPLWDFGAWYRINFFIFHQHIKTSWYETILKIPHAVAQWLRHCATNRKVAGSIPIGVTGIFHWHNPSGRTMVLGSTQPLTEMRTSNISWG
jgi:hypothetical protein